MALSQARQIAVGETPYAHEREGIEFAVAALPDRDPFHLWALLNLLDPSSGRLHEIDLIVMGYSAIYLVELKHYGGEMRGDGVDWTWVTPEGRELYRDNPYGLTRRKAQILKSRLERTSAIRRAAVRVPWIQPLVFLSNSDIKLNLTDDGRVGVVTQSTFAEAITHGVFPGSRHQKPTRQHNQKSHRIDAKQQRAIALAFAEIGLRPRKGKLHVGSYELGGITAETDSYQDRTAVHRDTPTLKKRARTYLVPEQTSIERRQQLRRAADRESQLLYEVREHPNVLTFTDYIADAPLGPTVLFDAFEEGIALDAFLRQNPELSYAERIEIIAQIGRALDHCHKKEIIHGSVSPASVLVRMQPEQGIQARLFNFQLGGSDAVEATSHYSALASDAWNLYQAPELRDDPTKRTPQSDLYSLGSVAYLCLTGRAPATDLIELMAVLAQRRCLDPRVVDDRVSENVAELVGLATYEVLLQRADDVGEWVELLREHATEPEPREPDLSPLDARAEDILNLPQGGELIVHGVLGHGATSRVLHVERGDGREFALKVSISPDHDERLEAEAKVLQGLRHPRIVQVEARFRLGGRVCLLLSLAGKKTLHRELAQQGAVSLDYAARFGEDLLSALEHLEENDIIHRDIKPANVGVGALQRQKLHLTLFDFSLGEAPRSQIPVGTAAYRDPYLAKRGEWDSAGDRWSAAMTLHEMLTAQRPRIEHGESGDIAVRLAAERFDSSVRAALSAFFVRAFAADVDARFEDAHAMRKAWERVFESQAFVVDPSEATSQSEHAAGASELPDAVIAAIEPTTAIAALPLSNRAKNALDRAGVLTAIDLHDLADNRLSAVRGVGREVAHTIQAFRDRWTRLAKVTVSPGSTFFPGYRGESLHLATCLEPSNHQVLCDAGIATLSQLAAAPQKHIAALAKRNQLDVAAITKVLRAENERADELSSPTTLEGWLAALLPQKSRRKHYKHMRALFGLEGPLRGKLGSGPQDLARALGVTAPAIYIALTKSKAIWCEHPALPALLTLVQGLVHEAGGALALRSAAAQLRQQLPHDGSGSSAAAQAQQAEQQLVSASALVRVCLEVNKEQGGAMRFVRFKTDETAETADRPWIFASEDRVAVVHRLGEAADAFAARDVLAGPGEVARELAAIARDTALHALAGDKLARLAAAASRKAACSSRLELYPRNMSARRALELSSAVLGTGLTPADLRSRVHARYPAAEPLPERPTLDTLLADARLTFDPSRGVYARPGDATGTSLHTSMDSTSLTHMASLATSSSAAGAALGVTGAYPSASGQGGGPRLRREIDAQVVAAGEFEDRIRSCLEYRTLLVLSVGADKAERAAVALAQHFGLRARCFDRLFIDGLKQAMEAKKIDEAVVYAADKAGAAGAAWANLSKLAVAVAADIADTILPPQEPLLLTQPGLIHRYQLTAFLRALVSAAQDDAAEATVVLVPGHEASGSRIEGLTEIPGLLPGQSIRLSKSWLAQHPPR